MSSKRRLKATVQADGRIEVRAPDLSIGETVEVIIVSSNGAKPKRGAREILAQSPGHRLFKTAAEVDAYIRNERDSWDH